MKNVGGMTLIELLIVIGIVGLTASLVAPVGIKQVARARADAEWLTVQRTINGISFRAFAQGRSFEIEAAGTRLVWKASGGSSGELLLGYTFFEPTQRIRVTRNGHSEPEELIASVADRKRRLRLNEWLEQ